MLSKLTFLLVITACNYAFSQSISIATGGTGGVYYPMGQGLASMLSTKVPGFSATAEVTGGSIDNINLISSGRPYIGFSMADAARDARLGIGRFSGKKTDLNTILVLYPNKMHIVTSESSGIRKLQDLRGKRVSTGSPRSATEVMALRVLEAANMAPNLDVATQSYSVAESANAIKEGRIDAFFWVGGLPTAAISDLGNTPEFRLSFIDHAEVVDSINRKYGDLYFSDVIPRTTYPGMTRDNKILSISNVLVANRNMPEKEVYEIVKAVFDNKNDLMRSHYEFINVTLDGQQSRATPIPFHPGAIRYFQERKVGNQGVVAASTATPQPTLSNSISSTNVAGTTWIGIDGTKQLKHEMTFFQDSTYQYSYFDEQGKKVLINNTGIGTGTWKQTGNSIYFETNNKFAERNGTLIGNTLSGSAFNTKGNKWKFSYQLSSQSPTSSQASNINPQNIATSTIQNQNSIPNTQGRRVALVIGNASYSSVPQLMNPTNDAREVTRALQATGFEVIRLENADLRQMQDAVRSFGNRLGKNDVGLFYFSGHGVQVKGKNYLIPVRENIKQSFEVPSGAIDADLVLATMENAKNNLNIMILDACRSPFPGEARSLSRGLATLDAAKGTLIAYATAPGKEALDGQGSNSPYTKHLVRALQQKGLPIEQVFKQVRIAVVEETKGNQVPWENSSIMGDFYFRK